MNYLKYIAQIILLTMIGCGTQSGAKTQSQEAPKEEAKALVAEQKMVEIVDITVEANDLMQFNTKEITVKEGQRVKLTLKHVGRMSVDVMGHNWVLLKPGTDKAEFGMEAISAKATDHIPSSMKDLVIVNTKLLGGGEETTIEFDAPSVGSYDFICSFPGHYGIMQGVFVVNPA